MPLVTSMRAAQPPVQPPDSSNLVALVFFSSFASSYPILGFLMAPFLFMASGAVSGDRLGAARQRPRLRDAPSDRSMQLRRTSARWVGDTISRLLPTPTGRDPLVLIVPGADPGSQPRGLAGRFHVCPRPAVGHHAVVAHSGNSEPHSGRGGSSPTPCPSSWGIVSPETT